MSLLLDWKRQIFLYEVSPVGMGQTATKLKVIIVNRAVGQRTFGISKLVRREQVASELPAKFDIDLHAGTGVFDEKPAMVIAAFPQAAVVVAHYLPEVFQKIPVASCGIEKAVLFVYDSRQAFGSNQTRFAEHFGIMRLFLLGTWVSIDIDAQRLGTGLLHRIGDSDRRVIVEV